MAQRTPDPGAGAFSVASYEGLISIVIPAYNEADRIEATMRETAETLDALDCNYEIVIVDDGSNDQTLVLANEAALGYPRVRVISNDVNLGKGGALIRGARAALGELVMFVDADMEVHPRQLSILYQAMRGTKADVVIGSKMHPNSTIDYATKRRILSRGYYVMVKSLFRLPVRDTQTGLKLYKRDVLMRIGPRLVVKRFAHDLEVLVLANRLGYKIIEAPVVVTRERDFPRVGVGDARDVAQDTLAIFYRLYIKRWYDRRGREIDSALEQAPRLDRDEVRALTGQSAPEPPQNLADIT